ncbi:hypothetical protein RRG08_013571 [Elysia crispata]|uniref:Uncharacterized protein n=1 Tax=Elysia crispata TaxID=231223 RepID=A0AAE1CQC8_9GAST|nr:hypothetical protein RRG08_013571 [Elysia crispata]
MPEVGPQVPKSSKTDKIRINKQQGPNQRSQYGQYSSSRGSRPTHWTLSSPPYTGLASANLSLRMMPLDFVEMVTTSVKL